MPNTAETIRLIQFIQRCYEAGVITHRQLRELEGVSAQTDPRKVLRVLTAKR